MSIQTYEIVVSEFGLEIRPAYAGEWVRFADVVEQRLRRDDEFNDALATQRVRIGWVHRHEMERAEIVIMNAKLDVEELKAERKRLKNQIYALRRRVRELSE